MGTRKTKLTKELIKEFCALIERGIPADTACDYFSISNSTYWSWLRKGQVYNEADDEESPNIRRYKVYGIFYTAFRRAVATYKINMVDSLHKGKGNNWTRDLAILERRDPDSFGRATAGNANSDHFDSDDSFL